MNSLIGSRKGKYKIPEKYAPAVVTCTYHLHKNRWLGIPHKNSYLIDTHFAFVTLLVFSLCVFAGKKLPECNGEKNEKKLTNNKSDRDLANLANQANQATLSNLLNLLNLAAYLCIFISRLDELSR